MNPSKLLPVALAVVLTACQTTPPQNPALNEARRAYDQARTDPYVTKSASVELDKARQALVTAEQAWAARRDDDETKHLSYLAYQRAQAARLVGEQHQSEDRLAQAKVERERIRADANANLARNAQAQAAQTSDQLQRALEQLSAKKTDRGMVLSLSDVLFDFGKANLKAGGQRTAQRVADVLKQYPERRVQVEGHTDSVGTDEQNQALSERRAEAFKQALVDAGVPADRVTTKGYGEAYPVATNKTPAGRQQNRRVEVIFSDESGQIKPR